MSCNINVTITWGITYNLGINWTNYTSLYTDFSDWPDGEYLQFWSIWHLACSKDPSGIEAATGRISLCWHEGKDFSGRSVPLPGRLNAQRCLLQIRDLSGHPTDIFILPRFSKTFCWTHTHTLYVCSAVTTLVLSPGPVTHGATKEQIQLLKRFNHLCSFTQPPWVADRKPFPFTSAGSAWSLRLAGFVSLLILHFYLFCLFHPLCPF